MTIVLICVCSDFCPGYTGLLTNDVYYTFCSPTECPSWQLLKERSMRAVRDMAFSTSTSLQSIKAIYNVAAFYNVAVVFFLESNRATLMILPMSAHVHKNDRHIHNTVLP